MSEAGEVDREEAPRRPAPLEDPRFGRLSRPDPAGDPWAALRTRKDWLRVLGRVAPCVVVCALFGAVGGGLRDLLGGAALAGWAFTPAALVQVARREREGYWTVVLPVVLAGLAGGVIGLLNYAYVRDVDVRGLAAVAQGARGALADVSLRDHFFAGLAFAAVLGIAAGARARARRGVRVLGSLAFATLGGAPFVLVASGIAMARPHPGLVLGVTAAVLFVGGVLAAVHALVDSVIDGLPDEG